MNQTLIGNGALAVDAWAVTFGTVRKSKKIRGRLTFGGYGRRLCSWPCRRTVLVVAFCFVSGYGTGTTSQIVAERMLGVAWDGSGEVDKSFKLTPAQSADHTPRQNIGLTVTVPCNPSYSHSRCMMLLRRQLDGK